MEASTPSHTASTQSYRCHDCGHVLTLMSQETISDCPVCGGRILVRTSPFSERRHTVVGQAAGDPGGAEHRVREARLAIEQPGEYLAYDDDGQLRVAPLTREWTRIGRSLAADVRFDDPTVSRRHALIVRQADGVRILDDRSLNGVFVNGERVEWSALSDGDEIVVGRYQLSFVVVTPGPEPSMFATTPGASDASDG